ASQADRELLEVLTTEKVLPEEISAIDEIELLRSRIVHQEEERPTRQEELDIIHRSAPKDDLYSTVTIERELVGHPEVQVPFVQEETVITEEPVQPTIVLPQALREPLAIITSDKFTPELISAITDQQVIRTSEVEILTRPDEPVDIVHRVTPKDDAFATKELLVPTPSLPGAVEEETIILEETIHQRRPAPAVDTFDTETAPTRVTGDLVPAISSTPASQADRELLEVLTTEKVFPDMRHRFTPKDDILITILSHTAFSDQTSASFEQVFVDEVLGLHAGMESTVIEPKADESTGTLWGTTKISDPIHRSTPKDDHFTTEHAIRRSDTQIISNVQMENRTTPRTFDDSVTALINLSELETADFGTSWRERNRESEKSQEKTCVDRTEFSASSDDHIERDFETGSYRLLIREKFDVFSRGSSARFSAEFIPAEFDTGRTNQQAHRSTIMPTDSEEIANFTALDIRRPSNRAEDSVLSDDQRFTELSSLLSTGREELLGVFGEQTGQERRGVEWYTEDLPSENAQPRSFERIRHRSTPKDDTFIRSVTNLPRSPLYPSVGFHQSYMDDNHPEQSMRSLPLERIARAEQFEAIAGLPRQRVDFIHADVRGNFIPVEAEEVARTVIEREKIPGLIHRASSKDEYVLTRQEASTSTLISSSDYTLSEQPALVRPAGVIPRIATRESFEIIAKDQAPSISVEFIPAVLPAEPVQETPRATLMTLELDDAAEIQTSSIFRPSNRDENVSPSGDLRVLGAAFLPTQPGRDGDNLWNNSQSWTTQIKTEDVLSENAEARSYNRIRHRCSPKDDIYTTETFVIPTEAAERLRRDPSVFQTLRSETPIFTLPAGNQTYHLPAGRSTTSGAPGESSLSGEMWRRTEFGDNVTSREASALPFLHRVGPRDDWFQLETAGQPRRESHSIDVTRRASTAAPSATESSHTNYVRRESRAVAEIVIQDFSSTPAPHKILHRVGPKDFNFETYYAVVSKEDADRLLGTTTPIPASSVLAEFKLSDILTGSDAQSTTSSSRFADLNLPPASPVPQHRATKFLAVEEDEAEVVAADVGKDGGPVTPRVLSRAPSRSSMSSPPPSRISLVAQSSLTERTVSYSQVSEYLESQTTTINRWLTTTSQSFEHGPEAEEVQTIISRSYSPATVLQLEPSVSSCGEENTPAKAVTGVQRAVVQVEVAEEAICFIVERPAEFAHGRRASPPLEMPAQLSAAVELKSTETRTTTRTTTSTTYEEHSCLVAYRYLYDITMSKLRSLSLLVVNPECQHIDPDILERERERFASLLDRLIRTNTELGRLDNLYRAILAMEPDLDMDALEAEHNHLNVLYMELLAYIRIILRRQKYLSRLLDSYQKEKMEFKMHLLDTLTYLRTTDNVSEEEQHERLAFMVTEAAKLKYTTYQIMVRSTPDFCDKLESEVLESMLILRAEIASQASMENESMIEQIMRGREVRYVTEETTVTTYEEGQTEEEAEENSRTITTRRQITVAPVQTHRGRTIMRAVHRALPMQTLTLVLIGFASLIPMANDDYACLFENYFASSFNPMLSFQGTPPF
ncbi:hypothetical protein RvY_17568, partial [Ramazzottius varieornatus]